MSMRALNRAWLGLALLSAATTFISMSPLPAFYSGALILVFAWAKARLVILWYLDIADVPGWRGGMLFGLALFMLILFGVYLAGSTF